MTESFPEFTRKEVGILKLRAEYLRQYYAGYPSRQDAMNELAKVCDWIDGQLAREELMRAEFSKWMAPKET